MIIVHRSLQNLELSPVLKNWKRVFAKALPRVPQFAIRDLTPDLVGQPVIQFSNMAFEMKHFDKYEAIVEQAPIFIAICDDPKGPLTTQVRRSRSGKTNTLVTHYRYMLQHLGATRDWSLFTEQRFVNLNLAAYQPQTPRSATRSGFIYWGQYREDRHELFRRYLDTNLYPVTLSASLRSQQKFETVCPHASCREKLLIPSDLLDFRSSVYITDKTDAELGPCPANRYYEALSTGLTLGFDEGCLGSFNRVPDNWITKDAEDMLRVNHDVPNWLQSNMLCRDFASELNSQLETVFKEWI